MRRALAVLLLLMGCATTSAESERDAISHVLNDFHKAASEADESRYFSHMTSDAIFLGTDATERWDAPAFRKYAHPHFVEDKGWTFTPRDRNVTIHGDVAWFDEVVESASYGQCRGTGVLRKEGGTWRIAQYNLTIPIPNDLATGFIQKIREHSNP